MDGAAMMSSWMDGASMMSLIVDCAVMMSSLIHDRCAQTQHVIQLGCIKPLVDLLQYKDPKLIQLVLDCLTNIIKAGAGYDGAAILFLFPV